MNLSTSTECEDGNSLNYSHIILITSHDFQFNLKEFQPHMLHMIFICSTSHIISKECQKRCSPKLVKTRKLVNTMFKNFFIHADLTRCSNVLNSAQMSSFKKQLPNKGKNPKDLLKKKFSPFFKSNIFKMHWLMQKVRGN